MAVALGIFIVAGRGTSDTMSTTPKAPRKRKKRHQRDRQEVTTRATVVPIPTRRVSAAGYPQIPRESPLLGTLGLAGRLTRSSGLRRSTPMVTVERLVPIRQAARATRIPAIRCDRRRSLPSGSDCIKCTRNSKGSNGMRRTPFREVGSPATGSNDTSHHPVNRYVIPYRMDRICRLLQKAAQVPDL